jgi:hypothetical protein
VSARLALKATESPQPTGIAFAHVHTFINQMSSIYRTGNDPSILGQDKDFGAGWAFVEFALRSVV